MSTTITIGYSPCPNDTYIFYGLVHGKVAAPGIRFRERLEDVETLNQLALDGALDVTKISYHALGHLRRTHVLLKSGGALGRGCGPLIVTKRGAAPEALQLGPVAIPGRLTTAWLLLRLYDPFIDNVLVMPFDRIMAAVADGQATAGLIIHESRFTYQNYDLVKMLDLGQWWEQRTGLPLPLGGILGKRSLGREQLTIIEDAIRKSLLYARTHESEVLDYCRQHSQEMETSVMGKHIDLYVNEFSLDLGDEGIRAVRKLFAEAEARGIFAADANDLFA